MPHRVNLRREADLARLAALYLQGKSQVEIALELRISQPQVSRDLATLQRRWLASSLLDFDAARARELARIAHLERVYWQSWERSTQDRGRAAPERPAAGAEDREPLSGNAAFLAGVRWCIDRRCRVLGLDAAAKWEVTGKEGGPLQVQQEREYDPRLLAEWERLLLRAPPPPEPA